MTAALQVWLTLLLHLLSFERKTIRANSRPDRRCARFSGQKGEGQIIGELFSPDRAILQERQRIGDVLGVVQSLDVLGDVLASVLEDDDEVAQKEQHCK